MVDETIALYHRLRWLAEQIYGEEGHSTAGRGVLRGLVRYGPQTVPALARKRFVSRQHVQQIVNLLADAGLVELGPNPDHARSRLVRATARGETLVKSMDHVDVEVLAAAAGAIPASDLEATARTLSAIRLGFERDARWRRAPGKPP